MTDSLGDSTETQLCHFSSCLNLKPWLVYGEKFFNIPTFLPRRSAQPRSSRQASLSAASTRESSPLPSILPLTHTPLPLSVSIFHLPSTHVLAWSPSPLFKAQVESYL